MKGAPDARLCWDVSFVKLIVDNKRDVFCSSLPRGRELRAGMEGTSRPQPRYPLPGCSGWHPWKETAASLGPTAALQKYYREHLGIVALGGGDMSQFGHPSSTLSWSSTAAAGGKHHSMEEEIPSPLLGSRNQWEITASRSDRDGEELTWGINLIKY